MILAFRRPAPNRGPPALHLTVLLVRSPDQWT